MIFHLQRIFVTKVWMESVTQFRTEILFVATSHLAQSSAKTSHLVKSLAAKSYPVESSATQKSPCGVFSYKRPPYRQIS